MRVTARPRVHAGHTLSELDTVDLEALSLSRQWGWQQEVVYVNVRPCQWEDCGGSVLSLGGEAHCLLCARVPEGVGN